ncbi:MAG: ABC transporter permease [Bdellovibrionales bacterium]
MLRFFAFKMLRGGGKFTNLSFLLSLISMTMGVAILILAMGIVSGFEKTIRDSIIDFTGHIVLQKGGYITEDISEKKNEIEKVLGQDVEVSPFINTQAVITNKGKVSGILLQGLDTQSFKKVLSLEKRLIAGAFEINDSQRSPKAVVGKSLVKRLGLKVGDRMAVVIPKPSRTQSNKFNPRIARFEISGVVDFGKNEYNERFVIVGNRSVQRLLGLNKKAFEGIRILLANPETAIVAQGKLMEAFGYPYSVRAWQDFASIFFQALEVEKRVIFLVLLTLVIVATFNTASALFINVMKRYKDIAVLKAMGASPTLILKIFSLQGIVIGFVSTLVGAGIGLLLCYIVSQFQFIDIPPDIYKIDHLPIDIRFNDVGAVMLASFILSFLATLIPAYRGSKLLAVEGLRYE